MKNNKRLHHVYNKKFIRGALCFWGLLIGGVGVNGTVMAVSEPTYTSPERVIISEKEYTRRFGDETMELAKTDPELAAIMKRFVYGDIIQQTPQLTERQRAIVTVAVLTATGNEALLKDSVKESLNLNIDPLVIRETVYQTAPYIGLPQALVALQAVNSVFEERSIPLPLKSVGTVTEANRLAKGIEIQTGVFGDRITKMRNAAPTDEKALQDNLSAYCFGDTYTRGVLDNKERELIIFTVLSALGGPEAQLKGHIQGNILVGNTRNVVIGALMQAMPYIGMPRTLNAIRCLDEVVPPNS